MSSFYIHTQSLFEFLDEIEKFNSFADEPQMKPLSVRKPTFSCQRTFMSFKKSVLLIDG